MAEKFAYRLPETPVTQQVTRAERNMALSRTLRGLATGMAIALATATLALDAVHKTDFASLTAGGAMISSVDAAYYSVLLRLQHSSPVNPASLLRGTQRS